MQTPEIIADQLHVISTMLKHQMGVRALSFDEKQPLGTVLTKDDFARFRLSIWDDYQKKIEVIDSLKDVAFILSEKQIKA